MKADCTLQEEMEKKRVRYVMKENIKVFFIKVDGNNDRCLHISKLVVQRYIATAKTVLLFSFFFFLHPLKFIHTDKLSLDMIKSSISNNNITTTAVAATTTKERNGVFGISYVLFELQGDGCRSIYISMF